MNHRRRSERILIVDDTSNNLVLLNEILSGAGYNVSVASNGADALESARLAPPDMVLLDILMPGMDGYEVLAALKGDQTTAAIPVLLLSALGEIESKTKGFECGACDYITKPFHLMEVLARMDTHLRVANLERRLRWSEGAMREGERIAGIGTWTRDLGSGQIEWSDELFALLGADRSAGRAIASILDEVVFSDDLRKVRGMFTDPVACLEGGQSLQFRLIEDGARLRMVRAEGKRFAKEKASGNDVFIGVIQDITRIHTEHESDIAALRGARRILDRHLDGIVHLDRDGRITEINGSFLHLVGKRPEEWIGNRIDVIGVPDSDGCGIFDSICRAVISGSQRLCVKISTRDGAKEAELVLVSADDTGSSMAVFVRVRTDDGTVG